MNKEDPQVNALSALIKSMHINTQETVIKTHDVYLDQAIEEPSSYRDLISILMNASELDTVNIYFNSPGGNLDSACAIITAIQCSDANVKAHLIGACHSAASIISMYCSQVHVFNTAYMMVHTASFGSAGNTPTIKAHTDFTVTQIEKLLLDAYEGFLTKVELTKVINGIEVWFDSDQIVERFRGRMKVLSQRVMAITKAEPEDKPKLNKKSKVVINGGVDE